MLTTTDTDLHSGVDAPALDLPFDNTYARLPATFAARLDPAPVSRPALVKLNRPLAARLGLDADPLASPAGVAMFAGNLVPPGAQPIAQAYAGHQFGHYSPRLGDGRAILLGEIVAPDGARFDIQLKGSGRTPFSRGGDGRAAVGPVLREFVLGEAMAALGIPTTRALAAVTTGDPVYRESVLPGAVLTRVAASHIRVGTFQYFAAQGDVNAVRQLADYAIARHYPDVEETAEPYREFLERVVLRQADLIAQWLLVGFIHGVMNTDNMAVSGETIDYGPCAFLEAYDPSAVFSSIDHGGRYAYGNQPRIAHWNLARLAETLLPLLADEPEAAAASAHAALALFAPRFEAAYVSGLRRKLGLATAQDEDRTLAQDFLALMAANEADFTLTFRLLADAALGTDDAAPVRALFADAAAFDAWSERWRARLAEEQRDPAATRHAMRSVNPLYIPRNHRVEEAITAAVERGDYQPFETLLAAVSAPFDDNPEWAHLAVPAAPEERVCQTFCGT